MSHRFILISGCSGGGKSTLLAELARRGYAVAEEPGRRIVAQARITGEDVLPWSNPEAFLHRAIAIALADRTVAAAHPGPVFFDRGQIDAASGLQALTGEPVLAALAAAHPGNHRVFFAPPWPEIYETNPDRPHGFDAAMAECERLARDYPVLGYELMPLPTMSVRARADFVLGNLSRDADPR
jgi:predicted ATPase